MNSKMSRVTAAVIGAGVMLAMSAALDNFSVAFAIGIAVFAALGGLAATRCDKE